MGFFNYNKIFDIDILQIWTRKYVYIWNLTCTWSDTIHLWWNMHRNAQGGQIFNFQKTFDWPCDEIRMEIQTENFFRSLISRRFIWISRKTKSKKIEYNYQCVFFYVFLKFYLQHFLLFFSGILLSKQFWLYDMNNEECSIFLHSWRRISIDNHQPSFFYYFYMLEYVKFLRGSRELSPGKQTLM